MHRRSATKWQWIWHQVMTCVLLLGAELLVIALLFLYLGWIRQ